MFVNSATHKGLISKIDYQFIQLIDENKNLKVGRRNFLSGTVDKNLPANAGTWV